MKTFTIVLIVLLSACALLVSAQNLEQVIGDELKRIDESAFVQSLRNTLQATADKAVEISKEVKIIANEINTALANNASCHYSKETTSFGCFAAFNQTIAGHHIEFSAAFNVSVNMHNESATIVFIVNGGIVYQKTISVHDLTIPICVPILDKLQVKLCLEFSDIKFSKEKQCFSAKVALTLKVLVLKKWDIIPPTEFGWNTEKCDQQSAVATKKRIPNKLF